MLCAPVAAVADEAPTAASAKSATTTAPAPQVDRMELMQTMRARMQEMMKTEDPAKRKTLMEAQAKDMDVMMRLAQPMPGMGMMMGPGMGMMMGPGGMPAAAGQKNCRMAYADNCARHDDATDHRLDALEKRVDMMQMMMRMMLRD
jgi:replicative DNA helicase